MNGEVGDRIREVSIEIIKRPILLENKRNMNPPASRQKAVKMLAASLVISQGKIIYTVLLFDTSV